MGAKIAIGGARSARAFGGMLGHRKHGYGLLGLTVRPLWPPTTGTTTSLEMAGFPITSATKVEARTTSRVVTPKILLDVGLDTWNHAVVIGHLLGSKTPCFLKTSTTMGTVELTGFEMTRTNAFGAVVAMPAARSRTIPPLICDQRVIKLMYED